MWRIRRASPRLRFGVGQNLFDLGANSLMMVQANGRIRAALAVPISLVDMFRFPTVEALSAHLATAGEETPALLDSHDRGGTRKDALARRRARRPHQRG